jgi:hypothetical protein
MNHKHRLDELPLAHLTPQQLEQLQQAEKEINQEGKSVYLIAFEKDSPSQ